MRPYTVKFSKWNEKLQKRQQYAIECVMGNIELVGFLAAESLRSYGVDCFEIFMDEKYIDDYNNDKPFTGFRVYKEGSKIYFRLNNPFTQDHRKSENDDIFRLGYDACSSYDYHYVNDYKYHIGFTDHNILFFNDLNFLTGWNLYSSLMKDLQLVTYGISYVVDSYIVSTREPVIVSPKYEIKDFVTEDNSEDQVRRRR